MSTGTAVQLLPADADRGEWLAARRAGIGASEIAALMGISPWESPFSLYWRKVNGWDFEPTAEMEWGIRLEPVIAAKYADAHPDEIVERGALTAGPEPWTLATPDRLICVETPQELRCWRYPDGVQPAPTVVAVLELKTAHSAHDGWGEPGTAEIPVHYRAQVQWQMLCVEVNYAVVAVLIGGSDYREYTVLRDQRDIDVMVEYGRRFMDRIATNNPPPIDDHAATVVTLKRLHPKLSDETVEVTPALAAGVRRARLMKSRAEALCDRYEAQLRAAMGDAHRAVYDRVPVASRSIYEVAEHTRKGYTVDKLNYPRSPKS